MPRNGPLSKRELAWAQHLHETAARSSEIAAEIDPQWTGDDPLACALLRIANAAGNAFCDLVGRTRHRVHFCELSTEDAAPWTQLPWEERG